MLYHRTQRAARAYAKAYTEAQELAIVVSGADTNSIRTINAFFLFPSLIFGSLLYWISKSILQKETKLSPLILNNLT